MKKLLFTLCLTCVSLITMGQLSYLKQPQQSLVIVKHINQPVNLRLPSVQKDNSSKGTATVIYLGVNGIISLNQFTSPPNVQRDLLPAYVGTIVLTSVAYVLFLTLK